MNIPDKNTDQQWQLVVDSMGRPFYHNIYTQQTSWVHPQSSSAPSPSPPVSMEIPTPLPPGWEEAIDPQGRVYYIDHVSKQTSWVHPYLLQQQSANPQAVTQKIPVFWSVQK
jgi:hypothetical protein